MKATDITRQLCTTPQWDSPEPCPRLAKYRIETPGRGVTYACGHHVNMSLRENTRNRTALTVTGLF